jgi:hypothetical protein
MDLRSANLELQIEELVLHGFAPGDRYLIGAAVQAELSRLFAEQGVPRSLGQSSEVPALNMGDVQVVSGMKPAAIGSQIAQSIYGGFQS